MCVISYLVVLVYDVKADGVTVAVKGEHYDPNHHQKNVHQEITHCVDAQSPEKPQELHICV